MKNLLLLLAGVATLGFSGCDDDDDDNNVVTPAATRTELITATDWMMVSAVETQDGKTVDLFAAQPETAQDDVFSFSPQGDVVREEGATREDVTSDDIVESGNWSFMNEEKNLKVELESLPVNDQIVELTKDRLVLRKINADVETVTTFLAD